MSPNEPWGTLLAVEEPTSSARRALRRSQVADQRDAAKYESVIVATPDDWQVHLRDDDLLPAVTPHAADVFRYALTMANLGQPVTKTPKAAGPWSLERTPGET